MTRTNGKAFWAYLAADAVVIAFLRFFTGLNVVAGGAGALVATLVVPRLHDFSRSGWWILVPFAFFLAVLGAYLIGWSADQLTWWLVIAVWIASGLAVAVVGLIPGQPGRNRYGEPTSWGV